MLRAWTGERSHSRVGWRKPCLGWGGHGRARHLVPHIGGGPRSGCAPNTILGLRSHALVGHRSPCPIRGATVGVGTERRLRRGGTDRLGTEQRARGGSAWSSGRALRNHHTSGGEPWSGLARAPCSCRAVTCEYMRQGAIVGFVANTVLRSGCPVEVGRRTPCPGWGAPRRLGTRHRGWAGVPRAGCAPNIVVGLGRGTEHHAWVGVPRAGWAPDIELRLRCPVWIGHRASCSGPVQIGR